MSTVNDDGSWQVPEPDHAELVQQHALQRAIAEPGEGHRRR